jgi:hypothetical protein
VVAVRAEVVVRVHTIAADVVRMESAPDELRLHNFREDELPASPFAVDALATVPRKRRRQLFVCTAVTKTVQVF